MMIKEIINKLSFGIFFKEEIPDYPSDFAIIDFSPIAKQEGIRDDQNKIVYRYFTDAYGNPKVKKYSYSRATIHALKVVNRIPILDKTKDEKIFPVFSQILPSEVSYEI